MMRDSGPRMDVGAPPSARPRAMQAGFMPVPLSQIPLQSLRTIAVYLRREPRTSGDRGRERFALYRSAEVEFTWKDRDRLMLAGVEYVYIRIADHIRFREQLDRAIEGATGDAQRANAAKAALLYQTSVGLIDEILVAPDIVAHAESLDTVSRSITTTVLSDPNAFAHLFAASHHDYYTATHMVNVGTWMVPLAHRLGHHAADELRRICQAGLIHDIGKIFVPADVLNKTTRLTDEEWALIQRHPALGADHLEQSSGIDRLILDVCRQHHERFDGRGYPARLAGEQICRVARMCAVVDAFDAMTSLRPFKQRALTVAEAIAELEAGVGGQFDGEIVAAWLTLLRTVPEEELAGGVAESITTGAEDGVPTLDGRFCRRPARVFVLRPDAGGGWFEERGATLCVEHIDGPWLDCTTRARFERGDCVRVYLSDDAGDREHVVHAQVTEYAAHDDGSYTLTLQLLAPEGSRGPYAAEHAGT